MTARILRTTILKNDRLLASKILLAGDTPLVHIAIECGFCSQSHFTTAFKAAEGITPARYRRRLRG